MLGVGKWIAEMAESFNVSYAFIEDLTKIVKKLPTEIDKLYLIQYWIEW
ncbi:hypothetical protein [Metallosphaera tengchongensis]|nr:hypothetical protein [Metallosphaera tengchongensis]